MDSNQPGISPKESGISSKISSETSKKDIETLMHHLCIAHELAINEDLSSYTHPEKDETSDENFIRLRCKDVYWTIFKEQISEDPPKLEMAFDLLAEIKKGLDLVMTPNITKLREQVAQELDLDALRTQAEVGAIDVMYYAKFILSVLSKICAPVRDKEVAELSKETDIVSLFRGIMELISIMKYDLLSYSLAVIKPDIMANHLAYERDTFREYVEAIGGSLPATAKWLEKHKDLNKDVKSIVIDGFMDLLTWNDSEKYPEALFLEEERLKKLKLDYFRLIISCTLMYLVQSLLPKELQCDDEFKNYIKKFIMILVSEATCDNDVKEFTKNIVAEIDNKVSNIPNKSVAADKEAILTLYQETIQQAALPDHKIRQLVCTRVNDYLRISLTAPPTYNDHFPPALNFFKEELSTLRVLFKNIFHHNTLVCMEHYTNIIDSWRRSDST